MGIYQEGNDNELKMIRCRLTRIFKPGAQPVKVVLVFILQDQFNMDKSKLNSGLMLGIYPVVCPDRKYDLAGLGISLVTRRRIDNSPD